MFKRFISFLCVIAIAFSMTVPVHAQENQKFPTIEDIEIVDDTTIRNIETKEYYIFSSSAKEIRL